MDWEIRHSYESRRTVNPSMVSRKPGGKELEKITIFSLKLAYRLLKQEN